mmetsp:Transcript_46740/g.98170  ORF Transcript_46740/g.98170 Transcript_46740/m.98170 type:complete len:295 (-) Transcript_46740:826-1710(-)
MLLGSCSTFIRTTIIRTTTTRFLPHRLQHGIIPMQPILPHRMLHIHPARLFGLVSPNTPLAKSPHSLYLRSIIIMTACLRLEHDQCHGLFGRDRVFGFDKAGVIDAGDSVLEMAFVAEVWFVVFEVLEEGLETLGVVVGEFGKDVGFVGWGGCGGRGGGGLLLLGRVLLFWRSLWRGSRFFRWWIWFASATIQTFLELRRFDSDSMMRVFLCTSQRRQLRHCHSRWFLQEVVVSKLVSNGENFVIAAAVEDFPASVRFEVSKRHAAAFLECVHRVGLEVARELIRWEQRDEDEN